MTIHTVLEERYQDLESYLRWHYKIERQEVLDDVFIKSVGKILRLAHKYDATKSSEWTWMVMVARGVAYQVLKRMDARKGKRYYVDVYSRGEREELDLWEVQTLLEYHATPESILSASQLADPYGESQ